MIPMDNHFVPSTSTTGFSYPASYAINTSSGFHQAVDFPVTVAGVAQEADLVIDWSAEEQFVLENGLAKLKDAPNISKYVKIAANLPNKTVRDVALRCRWMSQKRSKREDNNTTKNSTNRKLVLKFTLPHGKVVDTSSELNMLSNVPQQNALYVMNNMCHSTSMPFEGLSETVMDLLQQNAQAFSQISCNLSVSKLQDNISLFYQARNNISAILTNMKEMPGIMGRMPAPPVSINDELATSLLSSTTQPLSYTIPPNIHLKQEPRILWGKLDFDRSQSEIAQVRNTWYMPTWQCFRERHDKYYQQQTTLENTRSNKRYW